MLRQSVPGVRGHAVCHGRYSSRFDWHRETTIDVLILEIVSSDFPAGVTRYVEALRRSCGSPVQAFSNLNVVSSFSVARIAASIWPELPLLIFEAHLSVRRLPQELPSYRLFALQQTRWLQTLHRVHVSRCEAVEAYALGNYSFPWPFDDVAELEPLPFDLCNWGSLMPWE
jgi:hypothetical protein